MIKKIIIFLSIMLMAFLSQSQNFISHKGNEHFFAGINLAWMDFGNDLVTFNPTNFTTIMKDVSDAGGNSVRWWIHVDSRSTPTFANDTVIGISEQALANLETALDIAAEHGIVISLCLYSFDMMHKKRTTESSLVAENRLRINRRLLEDSAASMAYVNYALIPMVERVKGHTAILCWEIFNEPEGMTSIAKWAEVEMVSMKYIQRFINVCAGAIHRTDPEAKVSSGNWNAIATAELSGIANSKNYYSDAELLAAGGDEDGYLDFYMLHYYPEWFGEKYSPFHNPIDYWALDKPLLIGEFSAHGIIKIGTRFAPKSELSTTEAMMYLFNNGYAGGWGWTYTGHDGHGNLDNMRDVLDSLKKTHPELLIIPRDPNHNYAPQVIKLIPDTVLFKNSLPITTYVNLNDYFSDEAPLLYTIDQSGPASFSIFEDSLLSISVSPNQTGLSLITIHATDVGGKKVSSQCNIIVRDSVLTSPNKLLYALSSSSSEENNLRRRVFCNDGDMTSRWSSSYNDAQWIEFDMLTSETISRIVMHWEAAYGDIYAITVSKDKETWKEVFSIGSGQKNIVNIVFPSIECRYIRIDFSKRATGWGYSLFEVEAYTDNAANLNVAPIASSAPFTLSFQPKYNLIYTFPRTRFTDANNDVLSFSARLNNGLELPEWISFDPFTLEFTGIATIQDTGTYTVRVTAKDWFQESAYFDFTMLVKDFSSNTSTISTPDFVIYPNPVTTAFVSFTLPCTYSGNIQTRIINSIGNIQMQGQASSIQGVGTIDISTLPKGIYILQLHSTCGINTQSIIIE